ncbi:hypothetical protein GCM10009738_45260 [Kitasatospora viridis]
MQQRIAHQLGEQETRVVRVEPMSGEVVAEPVARGPQGGSHHEREELKRGIDRANRQAPYRKGRDKTHEALQFSHINVSD